MFKLVKLLNGKHCAPEIVEVRAFEPFNYIAGNMYFFETGCLIKEMVDGYDNKKFVPIESLPANSGRENIKGFFVTEDMIFEVDLGEGDDELYASQTFDCQYDSNNHCVGVARSFGSFATVLDASEQYTRNKALVYFKN